MVITMKPEQIDDICLAAWLVIPLIFGVWWLQMRLGRDKRWFVIPAAPFVSRGIYFALPTFVMGFVIGLVSLLFSFIDPNADLVIVALLLWASGLILAYLEPAWMSPAWYRWLKKEHGDILPDLAAEAHRLGRKEWLKRVGTQEGLKRWVEDFLRNRYVKTGRK